MRRRDIKHFFETLAAVATVITPAIGWLESRFKEIEHEIASHDRQLTKLNFKVFGVTAVPPKAPEGPQLTVPTQGRDRQVQLADPSIFQFLKPKETPDEKPGK